MVSVSVIISTVSEVSCCTGVQMVNDLENMGMNIVGVRLGDAAARI